MGMLLFVLLVVLVATVGFWDTLAAIVGAAALLVLAVVTGVGVLTLGGMMLLRKTEGE
ncbi:MAG: hypothetical protein WEA09_08210 [Gemmatimonadota bacterium]